MTSNPGNTRRLTNLLPVICVLITAIIGFSGACATGSTAAGTTVPLTTGVPVSMAPVELTVAWPSPAGTLPPMLIFRTDRLYTNWHLWVKQETPDTVRLGITFYGQLGVGRPDEIGMPESGSVMEKGKSFGCYIIGDDCMIFDFAAPVNGTILEVNQDVLRDRELINASPYDDGWLVLVKIDNSSDLDDLLTYGEYFKSSCPPCHCNH
jgi:glycine cleavage system H protein